eukprot:g28922.t1
MEAHEPGQADEPGQAIADIATVASVPELAAKSKLLRKELLSQVLPIRNGPEARLPRPVFEPKRAKNPSFRPARFRTETGQKPVFPSGPFPNRNGPKARLSVRPASEPKRGRQPLSFGVTGGGRARAQGVHSANSIVVCRGLVQEVKGSLAQAAASTQELVHIVGVAYLASSATSLFHGKRCVVEGTLLGAYVQQVLAGFPVPKCDKTLREFRNRFFSLVLGQLQYYLVLLRCIMLFYAWDQEELTRRLLSFVTTQKHRDVFSLFVSACLRVSALQQALVQAAGAETLACLEYLTEHTQGGKPWTVASVGAYLADRSTSTGWQLLLAREPVLVDECGLCVAPNPATGGLDLQTLAMLVQGDMIILGSRTFRHKLRLDEQWCQHAQAQEQGDLHAQGDLSAFLQGVQVGGWNACDPLVPALYNARTTVMSLLGYEPQPVLIIARTVHPQEFIYVNYGSAFWEEQGPL